MDGQTDRKYYAVACLTTRWKN